MAGVDGVSVLDLDWGCYMGKGNRKGLDGLRSHGRCGHSVHWIYLELGDI